MDPRLQLRVQRYGWDRAAEVYDRAWSGPLEPAQSALLEMADLAPGEGVVEVACGSGLVTLRAADAVGPDGRVVATDLSEGMLERARTAVDQAGLEQVTLLRRDAGSLELPDDEFDVAISALGLMYVPDPGVALREMARVLRPGGRAAVAVWGERKRCGWADLFPIVDARVETEVCPLFFQLGTGDALQYVMEESGFREIEVRRLKTTSHFPSEARVLEAAFAGGPVAMAYSRFDEATRGEVHREYLDSVEEYRSGDEYLIPGEFAVVRGEAG